MHHAAMHHNSPEAVALADGNTVTAASFDPAKHTAKNAPAAASITAAEVARLQEIAQKHLARFPVAAPALTAWVNAYGSLQASMAKGASAGLAEMRTNLNAFLVASDAIPAAVHGNWG